MEYRTVSFWGISSFQAKLRGTYQVQRNLWYLCGACLYEISEAVFLRIPGLNIFMSC